MRLYPHLRNQKISIYEYFLNKMFLGVLGMIICGLIADPKILKFSSF
jgi:hypothetical protein